MKKSKFIKFLFAKLHFIGIAVLLIYTSCTHKSESPIQELKHIGQEMQRKSFVEYSYKINRYTSYSGEWPTIQGTISFKENRSDTIIGMKFRSLEKIEDQFFEEIYDGKYVYDLIKADSSVLKAPLIHFKNGHGTEYPNLELSYCAIKLFLTNPKLESEIDSLIRHDTIVNSQSCISYSFVANQKFVSTHKQFSKHNKHVELIFSKESLLPVYYSQKMNFKSGSNTASTLEEAKFGSYSFNNKYPASSFESESIPAYYDWTSKKYMNNTLALNSPAPDWTLPSTTGDSISLKDFRGKYVLLDFWFIGCGGCLQSIPDLNSLQLKLDKKTLSVLGINCLSNDITKIKSYCTNQNMHYPNAWNGDCISESYKINAAPIFYLINPQGKIVYAQYGHDSNLKETVEKIIKENPPNKQL